MIETLFHVREKGSSVRTELLAGLTTFMTMAYILMVNPGMFAELPDASYYGVYIATALSAAVGTILIGLWANLPMAQASAMGSNAFFVYTVCMGFGLTYANALLLVLLDGIAFVLLTVSGLRRKIFEAIPAPVRLTIPAGVGLFIAFIGLQNAGIVVADTETFVTMASFDLLLGSATWAGVMPMVVTLAVLIALAVFLVRGSVRHPAGRWSFCLILAGGFGNLIDRVFRGFVVDMFNVLFMRFAVFNVADICVVVGGIAAVAYYLLLMDKLEPREKKHDDAAADR